MTEQKVDFSSIEVMARLTDTEIEARELVDKWLLITYDIPHTEAGDKTRRQFLLDARMIGATRHTDSVYLLPWTKHAEVLALRLARIGEVCVWSSSVTDEAKAEEITAGYDKQIEPWLDEISGRIDRILKHLQDEHYKTADNMKVKTAKMLVAAEQAIIRRGSAQLYILVSLIKQRFEALG